MYLGVGDNADNWYEITEEEAEKIIAEREAETDIPSSTVDENYIFGGGNDNNHEVM